MYFLWLNKYKDDQSLVEFKTFPMMLDLKDSFENSFFCYSHIVYAQKLLH